MACKAKEGGKVSRRGEPSVEWYKDGKPQYYCYGYIDKMTDEPLPECKECRSHVSKAQDDLDEYNRRMRIMNEEKRHPPYLDYPKQYKVQTNADKIRDMTDNMDLIDIIKCPYTICQRTFTNCCECKLDWLQHPAEVEE